MDTENELSIYLEKIRRCFPKGFSKYFYKNKAGKDFSMMNEDTLNDILSNFRSDIIATQKEDFDFSYRSLVEEFGRPRKVMRELLRETLPEEEYDRLKQIQSRFFAGLAACAVIVITTLSVFSFYTSTVQSNVNFTRDDVLFIRSSDNVTNPDNLNDVVKDIKNFEPERS